MNFEGPRQPCHHTLKQQSKKAIGHLQIPSTVHLHLGGWDKNYTQFLGDVQKLYKKFLKGTDLIIFPTTGVKTWLKYNVKTAGYRWQKTSTSNILLYYLYENYWVSLLGHVPPFVFKIHLSETTTHLKSTPCMREKAKILHE